MPAPEDPRIPIAENTEPEAVAPSRDIPESRSVSSVEYPATAEEQHEESLTEIMERFIKQDQEMGQDVELFEHLKPVAEDSEQSCTQLIDRERLNQILEHARRKNIPYNLLGYLWELWDCHPEDVAEPPMVREHALSDVIRPMWEQGLEHELKSDLLCDLDGDENIEKLFIPQPQSEIDTPQNLYQLVRKAWDQNRMEELLGMIEENDDDFIGETLEAALARHREEMDEHRSGLGEKKATESQETS
ncbi:MAG: hypothetical protein V1792_09640 [Pseudomonadota bacterium]